MGILGALATQGNQFYVGHYFAKNRPIQQGQGMYFKYEQVNDKSTRYHQLVQNLITSDSSIVIRTSWNMGFEVQGKVELADGTICIINNIQEQQSVINPQANAIVKNAQKLYYLELT